MARRALGGRLRTRAPFGAVALQFALLAIAALPGTALAQSSATVRPAVRVAGNDSARTTYVMISGLVGGVAGYERVASLLLARGHRVVSIDPYHLSIDSAAVSFADLARRVDALLARYGVDSAIVVGHAHGAGVALRLAAMSPRRVSELVFLDVGALPVSRTKVFSAALRLAPFVAALPGGRRFIRSRIVNGLRENSGSDAWLDQRTQHLYTEPLLDDIGRIVSMAGRLANAREPEDVTVVVSRVRAPVTLILGAVPHPSGPDDEELVALEPLGPRLQVVRLPGVGHFPHEEAPRDVARMLLAAARRR